MLVPVAHPSRSCSGLPLALAATAWGCGDFSLGGVDEAYIEPVRMEERFVQSSASRMDVLWVVDDTASMGPELERLQVLGPGFLSRLNETPISWQMGAVSASHPDQVDAGLLRGDPWILTPELAEPEAALALALDVGTQGRGTTSALYAAWLALNAPLVSEENRGFRRPDSALEIIVYADGDDEGDPSFDDAAGALSDWLEEEAARTGQPARLSAIVGDAGGGCGDGALEATEGAAYIRVAEATEGVVASICSPDLTPVLEALVDGLARLPTRFPLQAAARPASIRLSVDGVRQDAGWAYDDADPAVVFDVAPPAGAALELRYEVAE
jgi:hypothetical protein